MQSPQILISTGEPSGDMHAARLLVALRERTGAQFFGMGGEKLREAGMEMTADNREIALIGVAEVLSRFPSVWRLYRRLVDEAARRKPALAIIVDYPDFNMRLAWRLHQMNIRQVYFISPQVWAWRAARVQAIRRYMQRVICIFPFEEKFYRDAGVQVDYVGHPLVNSVAATLSREEFFRGENLDASRPLVTLLPGSRASEFKHHYAMLLGACALLRARHNAQFVLAAASGLEISHADRAAADRAGLEMRFVSGRTYDALAAADASIVASGTATVEAALLRAPMVVIYKMSPTLAFFARRMVKLPHFAMVNLIAGRGVAPELFQKAATPEAVAAEVSRLLDSPAERERMQRDLLEVREKLRPPQGADPIARAADILAEMMRV